MRSSSECAPWPEKRVRKFAGGLYHVITRGNNRRQIFNAPPDYEKFLSRLATQKLKLPFFLYAYCLMSNHVHLLIERRADKIGRIMHRIIFIYNALQRKTGTARPDVTLQTQILRGNDVVVASPLSPISTEGQDPARLSYAAEIPLKTLPVGRYELMVRVSDRIAKSSSAQRVSFEVR